MEETVGSQRGDSGYLDSLDFYISSTDREISDCKWRISFVRTSLLAVFVTLSSLFYGLVNAISDSQLRFNCILDVAPYVVSVMCFAVSASGFWGVYLDRYGPAVVRDDRHKIVELLPHILVLMLILVVACVSSVLSVVRAWQLDLSGVTGTLSYIVFLVLLVGFLVTLVVLVTLSRQSSGVKAPSEGDTDGGTKDAESARGILYSSAFFYLAAGVVSLWLAWNMNERSLYFLVATQGSAVLVLLYFIGDRVDTLMHESHRMASLREDRSIAVHERLRNTPYGERYLNLETVDVTVREHGQ